MASAKTFVYAFGSNGGGQLGIGHTDDCSTPQLAIGLPSDVGIQKIAGGGNHSAILTTCGRVFVTGSSQLGLAQQKQWEKADTAEGHAAGSTSPTDPRPWTVYRELWPEHTWTDVACGWATTLLCADNGAVFGVGSSQFGELACVAKTDMLSPVPLPGLSEGFVQVAIGWRHCLALAANGTVYGWGWNKYGQLGLPGTSASKLPPTLLPLPSPIHQIACGHLHSLFLGRQTSQHSQQLWAAGSNKYGQLTLPDHPLFPLIAKPTAPAPTAPSTFKLLLFTTEPPAQQPPQPRIVSIAAGWHHSAVLLDNHGLLMWGRNDHGQLQTSPAQPTFRVLEVCCGSEHTLAKVQLAEGPDKEAVIAWGWNEHGNCTSSEPVVQDPLRLDTPAGPIQAFGAGCATSWMVSQHTK
ncbi:RCC1/BLIP-II protein [Hesseltinella vesiculosa]|uniref:RCC1/BLIP-II protein n=1 Tax=Hesseltinella vesiculosa TaxID=101127 RepID=A0A1X2GN97_9FUNG|nr:RCC1/BLIP-II protein [Hesseltinella vesiculosa]